MKPLQFYHLNELNWVTNVREIIYWPRGQCKFKGVYKFSFGDIVYIYELTTDHRTTVKKFQTWAKTHQIEIEDRFYNHVIGLRLEALLNDDTKRLKKLLSIPMKGSFKGYVVE